MPLTPQHCRILRRLRPRPKSNCDFGREEKCLSNVRRSVIIIALFGA
jgi:hypothetical protein